MDAMAVRKAVCVAGAERVVLLPLTYRMCGVDMVDITARRWLRNWTSVCDVA